MLGCRKSSNKATPLPLGKIFAINSVVFFHQFGMMMIFPFLPFMVQDFFPELSTEELGRKAGFLGSAYYFGNLVGSPFWGWISDIWGRRPVMLIGIVGSIGSHFIFGFSQNYVQAISARLVWGLLNGNVGIAKTYISEVCDDTNQAKGFAVIGTSNGLGILMGSVIGGFLARPAIKYVSFHHPFFCKFPYVLPVFVAIMIGLISLASGFIFLKEPMPKIKVSRDIESALCTNDGNNDDDDDDDDIDTDTEMISLNSENEFESINQMLESDVDSQSDASINSDSELLLNRDVHVHICRHHDSHCAKRAIQRMNPITLGRNMIRTQKEQCILCFWCCQGQQHPCTYQSAIEVNQLHHTLFNKLKWVGKAICTRSVLVSIFLYALLGCLALIVQEVYPLLMVTDYEHGGYNLDDNEIGTFIMIIGVMQLLYQLIVYPRLAKLLGYRHFHRISLVLTIISIVLLPWSNAITGPISSTDDPSISGSGMVSGSGDGNSTLLDYCGDTLDTATVNENSITRLPAKVFAVMLIILAILFLSRESAFTCVFVLINNSALPQTKGTINGVAQSLVAFFRAIGPTVGGLVFAWSENNGLPWPFNYHFTFYLVAIGCIGVLLLSCCLPKSVEKKRQ